ncbi:MAG: hypothetical protein M3Z22_04965 [Verrucomicrobiota bacterium]|nr:hypothetical protein [Verrucomicrobiota bacterium]
MAKVALRENGSRPGILLNEQYHAITLRPVARRSSSKPSLSRAKTLDAILECREANVRAGVLVKRKSLLLVLVGLIAAGVAFDQHRAREARQSSQVEKRAPAVPPLPQFGALLSPAPDMQISGSAMCGFCYWHAGGATCNTVLKTAAEPGIVFLLPNEQRTAIEELTGVCAGGDYQITARGTVTQYDGDNFMLVKNFDAVKQK